MIRAVNDKRPHVLIVWWESLETWKQLAISFPVLAVFMLLVNMGPFGQPLVRSVLYGIFEGGILSGLLAVATAAERRKR
jgi:hypothetical protein